MMKRLSIFIGILAIGWLIGMAQGYFQNEKAWTAKVHTFSHPDAYGRAWPIHVDETGVYYAMKCEPKP